MWPAGPAAGWRQAGVVGVRVPGGMGRCHAGVGTATGELRYPAVLPSPLTRRNGTAAGDRPMLVQCIPAHYNDESTLTAGITRGDSTKDFGLQGGEK